MNKFQFHDYSALPPPELVKQLDYSSILDDAKRTFNELQPLTLDDNEQLAVAEAVLVENDQERYWKIPVSNEIGLHYLELSSDPITKLLQADAYRALLLRNFVNQASLQNMIAYATGSNLDNLAANYGIFRHKMAQDKWEDDAALRRRTILAIEGLGTGGNHGWYLSTVLNSDAQVRDAYIASPIPCYIDVFVLFWEFTDIYRSKIIRKIKKYLNDKYTRVLGDVITVNESEVITYDVVAEITYYHGPPKEIIKQKIQEAWKNFKNRTQQLGHWTTDSAIKDILHQNGVYKAIVKEPQLPIKVENYQAALGDTLHIIDAGEY